jgi:hypothetical protein
VEGPEARLIVPAGIMTMKQRWAMFGMGAWLSGTVLVSVVAAQNFYTVDRLLAGSPNSAFSSVVADLGQPQTRDVLRYLASELNRLYFQLWNITQLALGLLVLWLIGRAPSAKARWGIAGMLGLVALMMAWLTPEIVSVGRSLDFVPRDPSPPGMQRFWILHGAYTLLEGVKLVTGVIVTVWIAQGVRAHQTGRVAA